MRHETGDCSGRRGLAGAACVLTLLASAEPARAATAATPITEPAATATIATVDAAPPPLAEAWWTGPVSASSADTLPRGHALVEPYLFDVRRSGSDYLGSLTYLLYGLTDRTTVGVIPTFGSARVNGSGRSRRLGVNDAALKLQHRLNRATPGAAVPTVSLVLQQVLPLGRYDRLGGDPELGIGSGAPTTVVGVYAQRVDILANGRPLRTRINLTHGFGWRAGVRGESVFGTPAGFRGGVRPGAETVLDLSAEYSVSRRVALATDLVLRRRSSDRIDGDVGGRPWSARQPGSASVSASPAVEYSWSSTRGVLLGVRLTPRNGRTAGSVTPVAAFNAVF